MDTPEITTAPVNPGVSAPGGSRCNNPSAKKGTSMIAQQTDTDPTPPPGADADIWEDDGHRDVYAPVGCVISSSDDIMLCPLVTTVARQDRAGALDQIRVEVDAMSDLTAEHAMELAVYLTQAAAIAEQWAGRTLADCRLSTAKAAVMEAYIELRKLPGNAGDYLRAALDSISDAEAVTR
jgi:hypothetical protein